MRAKDATSTIGFLNGENDIGVEEFIRCIKRAQLGCTQPHALLDMIISKRIRGNAEKAIRFMETHSYKDLYTILRANVKPATSITSLRSKLESCRQGINGTVQNFNVRYKQLVNELRYALLAKSMYPTGRMVRLKMEEEDNTNRNVLNLRKDIGSRVSLKEPRNLEYAQQLAADSEIWFKDSNQIQRPMANQPLDLCHDHKIYDRKLVQAFKHISNQNIALSDRTKMTC